MVVFFPLIVLDYELVEELHLVFLCIAGQTLIDVGPILSMAFGGGQLGGHLIQKGGIVLSEQVRAVARALAGEAAFTLEFKRMLGTGLFIDKLFIRGRRLVETSVIGI